MVGEDGARRSLPLSDSAFSIPVKSNALRRRRRTWSKVLNRAAGTQMADARADTHLLCRRPLGTHSTRSGALRTVLGCQRRICGMAGWDRAPRCREILRPIWKVWPEGQRPQRAVTGAALASVGFIYDSPLIFFSFRRSVSRGISSGFGDLEFSSCCFLQPDESTIEFSPPLSLMSGGEVNAKRSRPTPECANTGK